MSREALVLAADSGRARLFGWEHGSSELEEIADMVNADARLPMHDLVSDRQGRGFNRQRGSRTALGSAALQRKRTQQFAREVSERLASESRTRRAPKIFVFAEAEFLGLLRSSLRNRRLGCPVYMDAKNLTRVTPQRIREYLPKYIGRRA